MSEKAKSPLELVNMIREAKDTVGKVGAGEGFSRLFYFKKGETVKKVRFLTDFNDAKIVKFHEKKDWAAGVTEYAHPCLEQYGKVCPTCDVDNRPKSFFVLTIHDYTNEYEPKRFIAEPYGQCKIIPPIVNLFEILGTITGKDFEITLINPGTKDKNYIIKPVPNSENFEGDSSEILLQDVLEDFKKDRYRFVLPNGVKFEDLKDLQETPF